MKDRSTITVVICTHDRAAYLVKALDGLREQTLATDRFDILVVDNRSTDTTAEVVKASRSGLRNLTYSYEEELGLSAARNHGLQHATGDLIAFLDDDAIPGPEWLQTALAVFDSADESLGLLGGRVTPIWECERPAWLSDDLLPYLSVVDLGDKAMAVQRKSAIVGANMIFPTALLKQLGGFSTDLGRKGQNLLSNEELLLKQRLESAGYRSFYHPDVMVSHHVPADRVSKTWFLRRLFWQGQSDAVWWRLQDSPGLLQSLAHGAVALKCMLNENLLAAVSRRDSGGPVFSHRLNARYHLGVLLATARVKRRG